VTVAGHSHFGDIIYHEGVHNTIITPGMTPLRGNNPGYAVLEIDDDTLLPINLHQAFLNIEQTYIDEDPKDSGLPMLYYELKANFGVMNLTITGMKVFHD